MSRPKLRPTRSQYSDDANEIVKNVFDFCKLEKENGMKIPLSRTIDRTSALTGVSISSVKRFQGSQEAESLKDSKTSLKFDSFDKGVVRRTINSMYTHQKILPTLKNIKSALEEKIGFTGSKSYLRKELKCMGFNYKRCTQNTKVLMERPDVVLQRIQYLRRIKELRDAGHTVVYTDETYVHTSHAVSKCWQDAEIGLKIPFSKGERMIVLHAGSRHGFIPGAALIFKAKSVSGDYHSEMNHANFMKWLQEMLIPNLPANSVLVLDNAAYHNVQVDRCPTSATRKAEIQQWLTRNNIHYDDQMLKPELIQLCKVRKQQPVCVVDEVLARYGHKALRLPPYHADLNPIELIWGNLKGFVARQNLKFNLATIKELIDEGIQAITASEWSKCETHVFSIESQYWSIDIAVDKLEDPIIISLASDSETTDGSETDTASEGDD